jgi:biotin carboxylase
VDVLVDLDTGAVYLGELNPRISGVSSMTNVTAGAYADVPLFLFHLLEFMNVDYSVDVAEINERWRAGACPTTARSPSSRSATTGMRSPPRTRLSSCGSTDLVTSNSTAPTWAFW